MIKLTMSLSHDGLADGIYHLRAKRFLMATLYWANEKGLLIGWSPFACVPINPYGEGSFQFHGGRAIPPEATHILVRVTRLNFQENEEVIVPLQSHLRPDPLENPLSLCAMSDLHLTNKTGRIYRALSWAEESDGLLLAGDLTNDGTLEQFRQLCCCLEGLDSRLPILAVAGNHDQMTEPYSNATSDSAYASFQRRLQRRAEQIGFRWYQDTSGAYSIQIGCVEVIGLNIVVYKGNFIFPEGRQLGFLQEVLHKDCAGWRIVLCHAPLSAHNPQRKPGERPYLTMDRQLQQLIDKQQRLIFLSGHTHLSPNNLQGCVEYRPNEKSIYLDLGSVRPTVLHSKEEQLLPSEWASGVYWELSLTKNTVEICARSVHTGVRFSRGYYRFEM